MRVLLLTTPLGDGPPNGASLAAVDLACALASAGLARPILLVHGDGTVPEGCEAVRVHTRRARAIEALVAVVRARADVVHAMFAPRPGTGLALRALSRATATPLVQTVASRPRSFANATRALAGDAIVATSVATERALLDAGLSPERLSTLPLPFAPPGRGAHAGLPKDRPTAPWLLFAGDYEFGDALEPTLAAFALLRRGPAGGGPEAELVVAARAKTARARTIERSLRERIAETLGLRGRVRVLGEVPSLLPWIEGAAAVVLPARDTFAKLDHPRVLLESLALGVPIVVGPAPSLAELVREGEDAGGGGEHGAGVGEIAADVPALRDAFARALLRPALAPARVGPTLERRSPARVAAAYAALYARVISSV